MPRESKRKLLGMPRSKKGQAYMVIKSSKAGVWIVQPLRRMNKSKK